jgi:hypothetical protein
MPTVKEVQVTFDCADPWSLSLFWNEALGYEHPPPPPGFDSWQEAVAHLPPEQRNSASASVDPAGAGPRLFFQQVPEGKVVKNRVHLDVRAAPGLDGDDRMAALEAECDRLLALGATRLRRFEPAPPMSAGFIVMQDPEGNEFCLD